MRLLGTPRARTCYCSLTEEGATLMHGAGSHKACRSIAIRTCRRPQVTTPFLSVGNYDAPEATSTTKEKRSKLVGDCDDEVSSAKMAGDDSPTGAAAEAGLSIVDPSMKICEDAQTAVKLVIKSIVQGCANAAHEAWNGTLRSWYVYTALFLLPQRAQSQGRTDLAPRIAAKASHEAGSCNPFASP